MSYTRNGVTYTNDEEDYEVSYSIEAIIKNLDPYQKFWAKHLHNSYPSFKCSIFRNNKNLITH